MKLYITVTIVVLSMFVLMSCTSNKELSLSNIQNNQLAYSEEEISKLKGVSVGLSTQTILKKEEDATFEATIINNTDNDLRLLHANKVFSFFITDKNDHILNTFAIEDIGIFNTITSKSNFKETYTYKFDKLGEYKVWAVAQFTSLSNKKENQINIQTKKVIIKVIQ